MDHSATAPPPRSPALLSLLPNPSSAPSAAAADPYLTINIYAPDGGFSVGPAAAGTLLTGYYHERLAVELGGLAVKEALLQHGVDPIARGPLVPPGPSSGLGCASPPHVVPHHLVVQSAYCAVCKIYCDTQEVLNIHEQGKKHKKKLQKLQEAVTPRPEKTQATAKPPEKKEAPVDNNVGAGSSKRKRRKEAPEEDLETKKRRVIEGGAEPNQVKMCTICNVVVIGQVVYDSHISGSKHAAMVKQQQDAAAS